LADASPLPVIRIKPERLKDQMAFSLYAINETPRGRAVGCRNIDTIPTAVLDALTNYDWPGNIRELRNVLGRSVILTNGGVLEVPMTEFTGKAGSVPLNGRSSAEALNPNGRGL